MFWTRARDGWIGQGGGLFTATGSGPEACGALVSVYVAGDARQCLVLSGAECTASQLFKNEIRIYLFSAYSEPPRPTAAGSQPTVL